MPIIYPTFHKLARPNTFIPPQSESIIWFIKIQHPLRQHIFKCQCALVVPLVRLSLILIILPAHGAHARIARATE